MKVVLVDPSFFGLLYDLQLSEALAAAGAEVTLVGRKLRAHEEFHGQGFTFSPLFYRLSESLGRHAGVSGALRAFKGVEHATGLLRLERLVRQSRPDVVHLQWLTLPFLDDLALARLARQVPLVLTVHNSLQFHGRASSSLQIAGFARSLRHFSGFIVHVEQTRRYLEGLGIPPGRIRLLPHPFNVLAGGEPPAAAAEPADGPVRILFFGTIKAYKGLDVLVRAGLELARSMDGFRIEVAGKSTIPLEPLLAEIEAAGARARFHLDLRFLLEAELAGYLGRADIVVFPYRDIDASGAFATAVRFGKPIVASALGVFADPPACEHLRLVRPDDPAELAAALAELIREPARRAELAAASRRLGTQMLSWPQFAAASLDLYRELQRSRPG
jgi:glycosyltransferase involved in cell wall biosynthesis